MTELSRPDEPEGPGRPGGPPGPGDWPSPTPPYGYPPPTPPYGYPAPGDPWPPVPGYDPGDPLVNPPGAGLSGWFERAVGAVRRSWRVLLAVMLITQFLPAVAVSLILLGFDPTRSLPTVLRATPNDEPPQLPEGFFSDLAVFGGAAIVAGVVVALAQSVGWAATTWAVTRQAAGLRHRSAPRWGTASGALPACGSGACSAA